MIATLSSTRCGVSVTDKDLEKLNQHLDIFKFTFHFYPQALRVVLLASCPSGCVRKSKDMVSFTPANILKELFIIFNTLCRAQFHNAIRQNMIA